MIRKLYFVSSAVAMLIPTVISYSTREEWTTLAPALRLKVFRLAAVETVPAAGAEIAALRVSAFLHSFNGLTITRLQGRRVLVLKYSRRLKRAAAIWWHTSDHMLTRTISIAHKLAEQPVSPNDRAQKINYIGIVSQVKTKKGREAEMVPAETAAVIPQLL